jgi:hypothetical protein
MPTNAIWYGLLLLIYAAAPGENGRWQAEVYLDSAPAYSLEIRGDFRSGAVYLDGELLGEYESSSRYRQSYQVFPRFELGTADDMAADMAPDMADDMAADGASSAGGEGGYSFAGGGSVRTVAFDLTPVMAGRRVPLPGGTVELGPSGYGELFSGSRSSEGSAGSDAGSALAEGGQTDSGWILRRDAGQLSAFYPGLGLVISLRL